MKVGRYWGRAESGPTGSSRPPPRPPPPASPPAQPQGQRGGKRARPVPSVPTTPGFRRPPVPASRAPVCEALPAGGRWGPHTSRTAPSVPTWFPRCSVQARPEPAWAPPSYLMQGLLCSDPAGCVLFGDGGIGGWSRLSEGLVWPSKPVVCSPQSCSFGLPLGWASWGCRSVPAPWRGLQWWGGCGG